MIFILTSILPFFILFSFVYKKKSFYWLGLDIYAQDRTDLMATRKFTIYMYSLLDYDESLGCVMEGAKLEIITPSKKTIAYMS